MAKIALVTGASSGIGRAIAERLLALGYEVIGLGRSIADRPITHASFTPLSCDLRYSGEIMAKCGTLTQLDLLVNAAGFGRFQPHEEISPQTLEAMVQVNLTAPMLLSNLLLPLLKKNEGTIINITSIEALRSSRFSALYSATKSGLRAFGHALFEEVRKSGVNVVTINPDMTDTPFFDALRFGVHDDDDAKLLSDDMADMVEDILQMRPGVAVTEVTLRPQRFGITKKS